MQGTHFKKPAKGGSIKRQVVNPDLQEERDKCTFDQVEMQNYISIPGKDEYYKKLIELVKKDPRLLHKNEYVEMSRVEQQEQQWEWIDVMFRASPETYLQMESSLTMPHYLSPAVDPTTLHFGMFQTAVKKLGSDEQFEKWGPDIRSMKKIGCYA